MIKQNKKHIYGFEGIPACGCHIEHFFPVKNDLESTCIKCLLAVRKEIRESYLYHDGTTQQKIDKVNALSDRIEELKNAR